MKLGDGIFTKILLVVFLGQSLLMADDGWEPNDTLSQAKSIDFGTLDLWAENPDYFVFQLQPGTLQLTMEPLDGQDLNMILYNEKGQVIASNFQPDTETIEYQIGIAGKYYLSVSPASENDTGAYRLKIEMSQSSDDTFEPNNTLNEAKVLTLPGEWNLEALDDDWFRLPIDRAGTLTARMTPTDGVDINMELLDDRGNVLQANYQAGEEVIRFEIPTAGNYYLHIYPASVTGGYTLSADFSSDVVWEKKLENFGPVRNVAIALFDIDNDGKKEVFVATSKRLDASLHETAPAALICLEENGKVKWTRSFPAIKGTDSQTGIVYQTSSVTTVPVFANLDDDPQMEILVGTGGDTQGEAGADVSGQPGDKGGLYALDNDGKILWFHPNEDKIGGPENQGDGRPDGMYGSPVVFDIDGDGKREVIYGSWDQNLWILDAKTGAVKKKIPLYDTIWSTPFIADIDHDGAYEILINSDITYNPDANTQTGGIFHVLSADGSQKTPGFNQFIGNKEYANLKGKFEEQALWSSPIARDLDGDGWQEIIYGTGNFFHDDRGEYVRVWNHDGTSRYKLATVGRTFATPLVTDIDGDGRLDIVEPTLEGFIFGWDAAGSQRFETQTIPYLGQSNEPIFSSPIAADIDGDGQMEIFYLQGSQVVEINSAGVQLSPSDRREHVVESYRGSPALGDLDNDGYFDLVSGGNNLKGTYPVIYDWRVGTPIDSPRRLGRLQLVGDHHGVERFVTRFYQKILGRNPDPHGLNDWTERLVSGIATGADTARGFIFSEEFTNKNIGDSEFVTILYRAFFDREPDSGGYDDWLDKLDKGVSRSDVLNGFLYSQEFGNLCRKYGIIPVK